MFIHKSKIFEKFPEISFGLSTKIISNRSDKFNFNMSKSIGDSEDLVTENREIFFNELGLNLSNVVIQKQIHSDIINIVDNFTKDLSGDALITQTKNLGLAVSTADCTNIYLYDPKQKVVAAVHSGWAGTEKQILQKTLETLSSQFFCNPKNIYAHFGPSISQQNYEVGNEFEAKFNSKYLIKNGEKYLLDLKQANKDFLINFGVPEENIEISEICSFGDLNFHSYRRDKEQSGRAFGVISIRE